MPYKVNGNLQQEDYLEKLLIPMLRLTRRPSLAGTVEYIYNGLCYYLIAKNVQVFLFLWKHITSASLSYMLCTRKSHST